MFDFLERYPKAQVRSFSGRTDGVITEGDALVAYLQMLGTLVDFEAVRQPDQHPLRKGAQPHGNLYLSRQHRADLGLRSPFVIGFLLASSTRSPAFQNATRSTGHRVFRWMRIESPMASQDHRKMSQGHGVSTNGMNGDGIKE